MDYYPNFALSERSQPPSTAGGDACSTILKNKSRQAKIAIYLIVEQASPPAVRRGGNAVLSSQRWGIIQADETG